MTTFLRKMWKNRSKHKKTCRVFNTFKYSLTIPRCIQDGGLTEELEEWALAECEGDSWWREARESGGKEVDVRYAGMVPVERAASAPATAIAVRSALHSAKTLNKKLQRVSLDISSKGIVVTDTDSQDNVLSISIYRISYCSADAANARVFAVVEGRGSEHVAHVFTCPRSRHARALALALAHAFNDAYQTWKNNQEWQNLQGSSLQHGNKRLSPWEHFPQESDEEEVEDEQWQAQAPLVTFA